MAQPFITRPYAIMLDAVRFVCAFLVLASHTGGGSHLYNGPWPFSERMAHYSVVVFFVLSGLVISASVAERQSTLRAYAMSRVSRILPVAAVAVAFSMLMNTLYLAQSGPLPEGYGAGLVRSALVALSFLSVSGFGGDMAWNGAYWSLCYEAWYYALFGAAVFLAGKLRWIVLAAMVLVAGWHILLLLPIWLAGAWLNRADWPRRLSADRAPLLLVACAVAMYFLMIVDMALLFWLRDMVPVSLGMSEWMLSDFATGALVVVALAALRPLAQRHATLLERFAGPASYAAGFSFTLYLFHVPVLTLLHFAGIEPSRNPLHLVLGWVLVLAICAGIAELVERRTPALRRAVARWLDRQPPATTANA